MANSHAVFLLLALTAVMALASFLAGAVPLSMSLSQSRMRFISSIGIGILVGTSLVVIIPEGIEAVFEAGQPAHSHGSRGLQGLQSPIAPRSWVNSGFRTHIGVPMDKMNLGVRSESEEALSSIGPGPVLGSNLRFDWNKARPRGEEPPTQAAGDTVAMPDKDAEMPTFYVGVALIFGFVLMFLVDRLPRHASENFHPPPAPRHISLSNLGASVPEDDEESEGFLHSLAPTPKQSRSLATTTGLVIHAAADGIAMGASASASDPQLGFIVFVALMVHKAPAAFGLTSVLLRQGLSKRAARGHLIVFSLASPLGAWATFFLVQILGGPPSPGAGYKVNQWWTGMLLLFSAGTFLYVAMHAMQEDEKNQPHEHGSANGYAEVGGQRKQARPQMRDTIATVVGMLLPLLTQFNHHH